MKQLRRVSELTLMPVETILDEEMREALAHHEDRNDGYSTETMQYWLGRGLYPRDVRAKVRNHIREHMKQCTPQVRAFFREIGAR